MLTNHILFSILSNLFASSLGQFSYGISYNFSCPEQEWKKTEEEIHKCVAKIDQSQTEDVCKKFNDMTDCSDMMKDCLTNEDLKFYKDILIITSMKELAKRGESDLYKGCKQVKQLEENSMFRSTTKCNAKKAAYSAEASERCIHRQKKKMRGLFKGVKSVDDDQMKVVCNFTRKAISRCLGPVRRCFKDSELKYILTRIQNDLNDVLRNTSSHDDFSLQVCQFRSNSEPDETFDFVTSLAVLYKYHENE